MSAVVRNAVPRDTKAIREVYYKNWLVTYPNEEHKILLTDIEACWSGAFTPESIKKGEQRIAYLPPREQLLVAETDGIIVGVTDIIRGEEEHSIATLFVLPEYHREGIGKTLFESALLFLGDEKDIIADIAVYNIGAIKFFESVGFIVTPEILQKEVFRMPSGSVITEQRMRREAKYFTKPPVEV
jgi:GNAT superfamily N-acetyltransferase